MISLAEARAHVFERCPGPVVSEVPLSDARGLVTAAPVVATGAVPPFANSAMDGFAVRSADTVGAPLGLRIVGTLAAGAVPDVEVCPGEAIRIMTGAPMPDGADAVVMVEETNRLDGDRVAIFKPVYPRQHVGRQGADITTGAQLLQPCDLFPPSRVGPTAAQCIPPLYTTAAADEAHSRRPLSLPRTA